MISLKSHFFSNLLHIYFFVTMIIRNFFGKNCKQQKHITSYRYINVVAIGIVIPFLLLTTRMGFSGGNMELKSSAFNDGERIPDQYVMKAIGGQNTSLDFEWSNAPAETKSFAFSIIEPHPVANNWVHWLVINIPASTNSIAETASGKNMPAGSMEFNNSYGSFGYGGPQPPAGSGDHPYVCTVYALNVDKMDLGINASLSDFKKALEGKMLAQAIVTGKYGR